MTTRPVLPEIRVQVQLPATGFTLNWSKLGSDNLATLTGFTLGTSKLGDILGPKLAWSDYTNQALSVSIDRGGEVNGPTLTMDVGVLKIMLKADINPTQDLTIRPGRPIRVIHQPATGPAHALFTGTIGDIDINQTAGQPPITTIEAADAVAVHQNTTRYGAASDADEPESWFARIRRLCHSANAPYDPPFVRNPEVWFDPTLPPFDWIGSPWRLCDTVHETNLANHFDIACNSVGALWWVNADGVTQFAWHPDRFIDTWDETAYSSLEQSFDTRRLFNMIEITNHARIQNEKNEWVADDQTTLHQDLTSVATYGPKSTKLDVTLDPSDIEARTQDLLTKTATPRHRISAVTFDTLRVPQVATIELADRIGLNRANQTNTAQVVGIQHTIGPDTWTTTFHLQTN
jgi:hypothetical protein